MAKISSMAPAPTRQAASRHLPTNPPSLRCPKSPRLLRHLLRILGSLSIQRLFRLQMNSEPRPRSSTPPSPMSTAFLLSPAHKPDFRPHHQCPKLPLHFSTTTSLVPT